MTFRKKEGEDQGSTESRVFLRVFNDPILIFKFRGVLRASPLFATVLSRDPPTPGFPFFLSKTV
jgi:hypothetical protein